MLQGHVIDCAVGGRRQDPGDRLCSGPRPLAKHVKRLQPAIRQHDPNHRSGCREGRRGHCAHCRTRAEQGQHEEVGDPKAGHDVSRPTSTEKHLVFNGTQALCHLTRKQLCLTPAKHQHRAKTMHCSVCGGGNGGAQAACNRYHECHHHRTGLRDRRSTSTADCIRSERAEREIRAAKRQCTGSPCRECLG
jgi:hypothetical protein